MDWEGNAGLFTGHGPARGSGDEVFQNSRAESGRVRRCSELSRVGVGLGRVGAGGFQISRVGSGQEVFKYHGSGRVTLIRPDPRDVIPPVKVEHPGKMLFLMALA